MTREDTPAQIIRCPITGCQRPASEVRNCPFVNCVMRGPEPQSNGDDMSQIIIEDAGLAAIMDDPKLQAARRKLSFHEIRLLMKHARGDLRERAAKYETIISEQAGRLDAFEPFTKLAVLDDRMVGMTPDEMREAIAGIRA